MTTNYFDTKWIARTEGLDGRPIHEYIRLAKEHKNNLRMILGEIEAGCMRKATGPAKRRAAK